MNNNLIVILGPTASGKTALSIKLAKKYKGEIISADSRQVYKGLNIGSGKVTKAEMKGVPHYLLDVASPKRKFTVAEFQKLAFKKIKEIQKKGHCPFLVGGTGFYIQSIVDNLVIPDVKPDWKLRKRLSSYKVERLYGMLKKLDARRAKEIDNKNPVRLIRALEIVLTTKKPVPVLQKLNQDKNSLNPLLIGVKKSSKELKKLIHKRLLKRIAGIIIEVEKLHKKGLSWQRLEELGLEYRFASQYIQRKLTYDQMLATLEKEIWHFSKRQMTWFKRDTRIHWIESQKEAEKLVRNFLK